MFIRRIAVQHWRGLEALALDDLAPGLNLVAGPNEAGKTRLVEALRYALFEGTKGSAQYKKDLQTWGVGTEKPRVEVTFELAGESWTVEKQFLGTGTNTRLRSAAQTFEGEDAETRLAAMLGVSEPGTKELKHEDRGIWPLLWVDQGDSGHSPSDYANADAQGRLQDVLTAEVGEVAAGEQGQQLLARAREIKERYYTAATNKEKSPLIDARKQVVDVTARLEDAIRQRDAVAEQAEELADLRHKALDYAARTAAAATRLKESQARLSQAEAIRQRAILAGEQVRNAEAALHKARQEQAFQQELAADITGREAKIAQLDQELAEVTPRAERARADVQRANEAVAAAERNQAAATERLATLRRQAKADTARREHALLDSRLKDAIASEAAIRELDDELIRLPKVDGPALTALRELGESGSIARATLEGASATVSIHALRELGVDGEALATGDERVLRVDEDRLIEIEGVARIEVRPAGGELAGLKDAVRDAEAAFTAALQRLEVVDLATAQRVADRRAELGRDRAVKQTELERAAPEGRESLELALRESALAFEGAEQEAPVDQDVLDAAEQEASAAQDALDAARAKRDALRTQLQEHEQSIGILGAKLAGARDELAARIRQRDALPTADALTQRTIEAERQHADLNAAAAQVNSEFEALGGDRLELDAQQAAKAHDQLLEQAKQTGNRISALEALLQSAGEDGRHEKVQELEGDLAAAEAALVRVLRDAQAARRLFEVLDAASSAASERLTLPVIERIRPYLGDLFPGAELWLDEDLTLRGLRTKAGEEGFGFLSGGAREQLGLLVRIGLAEVLGTDESWPLVLDDALVNTDPERIKRVQRLLFQASRGMQILLFTCHGALFDALGPDRRIELPKGAR